MKHGPEQHLIRADGVYITSELQPTVGGGFNPVADTMAIAARFVAPTGLAGPIGSVVRAKDPAWRACNRTWPNRRMGHPIRALRGPGSPSLAERWMNFKARIKANMAANRFINDMRIRPAAGSVVTVDTSPRSPNSDPTALAVQSGWAPSPQSAATAAINTVGMSAAQGDPPNQGAVVTAVNMTPGEAAFPVNFWDRVIRGGMSPVVAARAEGDVLAKWFGVKTGGNY